METEPVSEVARIESLSSYYDMLYDDNIATKVRGSALILQLVQNPANLEEIVGNEAVTTALARVLAEDRKKSIALTSNILEIFFCFSSISELHGILINNKIGHTTIQVVDLELKRYDHRMKEIDSLDDENVIQYLQKQEKLLFVCFYILLNLAEDPSLELRMTEKNIIKSLAVTLDRENPDPRFLDHLRLLVLAFLKRLSVVYENQNVCCSLAHFSLD